MADYNETLEQLVDEASNFLDDVEIQVVNYVLALIELLKEKEEPSVPRCREGLRRILSRLRAQTMLWEP